MASPILAQTAQAAVLSATSNILAQAITAYLDDEPLSLSLRPILTFVIFSILSTPPNCLWQFFLEDTFPSTRPAAPPPTSQEKPPPKTSPPAKKLDLANTAKKFALDQTLGAAFNTWLFVAYMGGVSSGGDAAAAWDALWTESWPIYLAGIKLWPAVSLLSFTLVPVDRRVVFGSAAGVVWGVYLSLVAAGR